MGHTDSVIHHEFEMPARDFSSSLVSRCRNSMLDPGLNQRSTSSMPRDNTAGMQGLAILWNGHVVSAATRTAHMWADIPVERRQSLRQKLSNYPKICSPTPVRHNAVQICRSQRIENNV